MKHIYEEVSTVYMVWQNNQYSFPHLKVGFALGFREKFYLST